MDNKEVQEGSDTEADILGWSIHSGHIASTTSRSLQESNELVVVRIVLL